MRSIPATCSQYRQRIGSMALRPDSYSAHREWAPRPASEAAWARGRPACSRAARICSGVGASAPERRLAPRVLLRACARVNEAGADRDMMLQPPRPVEGCAGLCVLSGLDDGVAA